MKKKLLFLTGAILISGVIFSSLAAQTKEEAMNETLNLMQNSDDPSNIPDWLKRTSYGIYIETDQKPRVYIETIQPLYQSMDRVDTLFTHDRVSIQDERGTYSVGLGYRRLIFNDNLLAGINNFFDFQDLHKHYRTGVGLEAITKTLEFRANSYFRMSPKRAVESTSSSTTYERVANGGDVELGCPVPYLPWLKIFGSYYHYDFRKFKDMNGWKARGEIKPFKFITINLETYDDNKGEQEYRMDTRFNLAFDDLAPKTILSAFKLAKEPYPEIDLKKRTLDRVERNFIIQVEKWIEKAGVNIEIGRGS